MKLRDKTNKYRYIPIPLIIAFEPINLCNAKCYCCPYTRLSEDKSYHGKRMTREQISQLLNEYGSLLKKYEVKPYSATIFPWRYSDPLVQPDLEYIMALADKHKIKVMLTTNAISFTKKQCDIIQKYLHLINTIHVSVIGFSKDEIWELMKIKKEKTMESLKFLRDNYPDISTKLRVSIKHKQHMLAPEDVLEEYRKLVPNGTVKTKIFRVTNRLGDGDGDWTIPNDYKKIDRKWYIQGCAMKAGRILRQMEILVNGQVVLCCDDADGKTNHGNVFEIGIEKAWQNLQNEHTLIFEQKWSNDKKHLICNSCTRGRFKGHWSTSNDLIVRSHQYFQATRAGL